MEQQEAHGAPATPGARAREAEASRSKVSSELRDVAFPVALRGYEREAVDAYLTRVSRLVADLEARTSPEAAVERALERVGEETSAILRTAHEAAQELTARSRAQAEERLEAAEREARNIQRSAETRVRGLDSEIDALWRERSRLLEDVRSLAASLTSIADDAEERFPPDANQASTAATAQPTDPAMPVTPGATGGNGGDQPTAAMRSVSAVQPSPDNRARAGSERPSGSG